jgi:hypothetical protein
LTGAALRASKLPPREEDVAVGEADPVMAAMRGDEGADDGADDDVGCEIVGDECIGLRPLVDFAAGEEAVLRSGFDGGCGGT